jgi:hypothetical protein
MYREMQGIVLQRFQLKMSSVIIEAESQDTCRHFALHLSIVSLIGRYLYILASHFVLKYTRCEHSRSHSSFFYVRFRQHNAKQCKSMFVQLYYKTKSYMC